MADSSTYWVPRARSAEPGGPQQPAGGDPRAAEARIEARLHLAPRLRQVLHQPGLGLGPALWLDDAGFDIDQHILTGAIAPPGDEASLLDTCAELNQRPLDRSRPLWELWLLKGLASGNVGMLLRLHHVVADGTAALALFGSSGWSTCSPATSPAPQRPPTWPAQGSSRCSRSV